MQSYYVNINTQANGDHEVHNQGCTYLPEVANRKYLGEFTNCALAVNVARSIYVQVNGCFWCCRDCHTS